MCLSNSASADLRSGIAANDSDLASLRSFIQRRNDDPKQATLPNLKSIGRAFQGKLLALPADVRFAAVDLLRCAMVDARVGGFFAEEKGSLTFATLLKHVNELDNCPHKLRLVTIHLACNIFISPLFIKELMQPGYTLPGYLVQLITSSLLDNAHSTTRVAASSLAFNLAVANYLVRREENREGLGESEQVELAAGVLEVLSHEENIDVAKALLLTLGYLLYHAPQQGEVYDLLEALEAKDIVRSCQLHSALINEVSSLL